MTEKQTSITNQISMSYAKKIIIGVVVIAILALIIILNSPKAETYSPVFPEAFDKYQALKIELCMSIKEKGRTRLLDDANGFASSDTATFGTWDRQITAKYRDMDCSKVQIIENVLFPEESNLN